jgi:hypothetical protein
VTNLDQDVCYMSATTLSAAIRAKKLSPVELIHAVYARLHKTNDRINAFCTLTEEEATRAAREAQTAVMRDERLGVLHGLPISIKDLLFTRGVRTMSGSRTRENYLPNENAPAVARVLAAGAILIGKTTTPEFGFKAVTVETEDGVLVIRRIHVAMRLAAPEEASTTVERTDFTPCAVRSIALCTKPSTSAHRLSWCRNSVAV